MDQLQDFRSKLGQLIKTRPEKDQVSNAFEGVSVRTPKGVGEPDTVSTTV